SLAPTIYLRAGPAWKSDRDEAKTLPLRRRASQDRRPAGAVLMLAWLDQASSKGEFGGVCGERIRRHLVDARLTRSNGHIHILSRIRRHVFECLLGALAWMRTIEIERKRVEKLQLLVVLEQVIFLDPFRGLRILRNPSFQPLLPIDLASHHPLGQRAIHRRNSVDQDQLR